MEIFILNLQSTLDRYTKSQSFNPILESFLIFLFRYMHSFKEVNMAVPTFGWMYIFCQQAFSCDEGTEKSQGARSGE